MLLIRVLTTRQKIMGDTAWDGDHRRKKRVRDPKRTTPEISQKT